ncbi:3-hydroxybenzoate transporter MhbT [Mycobacterium simulans]|uniref:3-hydroxybenzoate transporter MhbT n=1 Tax=Mycobacterium simulans TaxID=627089 RepID=A0A7Z7IIS9_9MYCO|nr:MFS transporter [Mycobacterium simulans]SOJ53467.1 3-hydroxybenzoate transporter MhbT [Mycobacterium simulans]
MKVKPAPETKTIAPPGMLALLTAAGFVVTAQIYLVAPILPALARDLNSTPGFVGLVVPAFLMPYGVTVLLWGPLSDRWGRRRVILTSLAAFTILTAATPVVDNVPGLIVIRVATAIGSSGVVPIGLALISDLVPYQRRGSSLGWMFGGMAGGGAFGAAAGALGQPLLGWQGLFGVVGVLGLILVGLGLRLIPSTPRAPKPARARQVIAGFADLLRSGRGRKTYCYVLLNAALRSGIYTWFAVYLHQHYGLGESRIGLVLIGYGIPGLLLGPTIGHLADRYGRARIIPVGLAITACAAWLMSAEPPLVLAQAAIIALSVGYDTTQPLFAGIVTDLPGPRGQAIGLNTCALFIGKGAGSLAFQALLLGVGFSGAFAGYATLALLATIAAVPLFRAERPHRAGLRGSISL